MKAKVEVSLHPAPTDHTPPENWEEKLEGESLPVATASTICMYESKIYRYTKSVLSSPLNKGPGGLWVVTNLFSLLIL